MVRIQTCRILIQAQPKRPPNKTHPATSILDGPPMQNDAVDGRIFHLNLTKAVRNRRMVLHPHAFP